jgi:hypothetical protein
MEQKVSYGVAHFGGTEKKMSISGGSVSFSNQFFGAKKKTLSGVVLDKPIMLCQRSSQA